MKKKNLKFTVDSALLRELGEKLVETVHLALSELVKNAYDADATNVEIIFDSDSQGDSFIKIIDDGIGMNFAGVEKFWMRIATHNKEKKSVSEVYGRRLTGAKGIGRFSCRRLGAKLTLITSATVKGNVRGKRRGLQNTKVEFPWMDFEAGSDVTTITCVGEQSIIAQGNTGTTLIIEQLSDEWKTRGLNWLKRHLAVLTANRGSRIDGYETDPGFNILLTAPDFEGGTRDLRKDLINAGWGTLKAYINSKHQAVCELNAKGLGRRTIKSNCTFSALKNIKLHLGILVDDREQMRDVSMISKSNLQTILPIWGGIQIRQYGFRVYPYGDDDWLKIDRDRGLRKGAPNSELMTFADTLKGVDKNRSLLNMLSMRNYIGNVDIGSKSEGFEMKANREGFIASTAMEQLKEFVRFSIDWSTILRDYHIRQELLKTASRAKELFENTTDQKINNNQLVENALSYIESEIKNKILPYVPSAERSDIERSISTATEAIAQHNLVNQSEINHLRLIASTSTLLLIFSHEVKSLLGLLEQSKNSLVRISKKLNLVDSNSVLQIGDNFTDLNKRLEELLQMTSLISSSKSKNKVGRISLKSKLGKVEKVFQLIINKYEISFDYADVPNNTVIKNISEAEIYSILLNLISNSIKAVIAGGKRKRIKVESQYKNENLVISILDTGLGMAKERYNEVFIPFVSDPDGKLYTNLQKRINPEDSIIVGTGSGLGLGIVKEIINAREGTIRFKTPRNGWVTEIEIKLK